MRIDHDGTGDQAERLAATSPRLELVRMPGVGHLIHDCRDHRDQDLAELDRYLERFAAA